MHTYVSETSVGSVTNAWRALVPYFRWERDWNIQFPVTTRDPVGWGPPFLSVQILAFGPLSQFADIICTGIMWKYRINAHRGEIDSERREINALHPSPAKHVSTLMRINCCGAKMRMKQRCACVSWDCIFLVLTVTVWSQWTSTYCS